MILCISIGIIAFQAHVSSDILAVGDGVFDSLQETLYVALALIQTLASERMDCMCCVANQSYSLANVGVCMTHFEGKRGNRALLDRDYLLWDSLGIKSGVLVSP